MVSARTRFWILIGLVTISGFSQGMLLPLIAVILEQNGISSSINGLHATGLYIGILLSSPFMEKPLQRLGYKPVIMIGGALVVLSLALFPFWQALWFWFILRVTIGIGDQILHFGTQTWITATADRNNRGRSIAYYGLFFSLGFTLGPLMTNLLTFGIAVPFLISSLLSMIVWLLMFRVRNETPERDHTTAYGTSSMKRFLKAIRLAWVAFLPPLAYGFLEATLHGIFPVYGMRIGHEVNILSLIIPCFAAASLFSQIPLGTLSDKIGRKKVIMTVVSGGTVAFVAAALLEDSVIALFATFALGGLFVGSLFSLGISFMTDLLPKELLPAGNILCGMAFSIGSILGPFLSGFFLDLWPGLSFFYVIVALLIIVFIATAYKNDPLLTE
ncbi:Predicted arabinose efflux permease, MFS family [Halobacillus dabanensis]|uniref:Predicted arabinose efflux permease, MFS family n=1 Tax=Halobacillus dabanensis TaxID=240302 RepID=A0A1I3XRM8_HALDA|nr:MFS transporter [Halobacillus dabanensis]SFK21701.1 Predicted arabinose efflux permease, MFS family [Halobacillus dabanensis]